MIGIFDSGIGGVTVFKEILKLTPNYKYIYYSDSLNNPYGDKSKEELIEIVKNICKYLVNKGCKVIVIACNTASAICKDALREEFDIPIIAVEPALKMVYDNDYQESTLIMATYGTTHADRFKELYQKFDNHKMQICDCVGLADLIERNSSKINEYLENNLKKYRGVKNVVLGCTHYPLIKEEIKEVLGNVKFYDGSRGVAKRLKEVLESLNIEESNGEIEFIDSSNNEFKKERFYQILGNNKT